MNFGGAAFLFVCSAWLGSISDSIIGHDAVYALQSARRKIMRSKLFCALIMIGLLSLFGCGDNDGDNFEANAGPSQNLLSSSGAL
jgi:uncharacterized BrkB/YihY/UPF0761 family membrane protein